MERRRERRRMECSKGIFKVIIITYWKEEKKLNCWNLLNSQISILHSNTNLKNFSRNHFWSVGKHPLSTAPKTPYAFCILYWIMNTSKSISVSSQVDPSASCKFAWVAKKYEIKVNFWIRWLFFSVFKSINLLNQDNLIRLTRNQNHNNLETLQAIPKLANDTNDLSSYSCECVCIYIS